MAMVLTLRSCEQGLQVKFLNIFINIYIFFLVNMQMNQSELDYLSCKAESQQTAGQCENNMS